MAHVERRRRNISLDNLERLAMALGVQTLQFVDALSDWPFGGLAVIAGISTDRLCAPHMIRAVLRGAVDGQKAEESARAAKRKEGVAIQLMGLGAALLVIPPSLAVP